MQIVRKDIDALNVHLDITLEPSDYASTYEEELKKYKNKAQIKGFRKGMTPMSTVKKMYGKHILVDVINNSLSKVLYDYLDEQKLNFLAQPLPNQELAEKITFDVNNYKDYNFGFELGLAPEVTVTGVTENDAYDLYEVALNGDTVDKEIEALRKRAGKQVEIEDQIQADDMVYIEAIELEDGNVNENGWKTEFSVLVNMIKDETTKNQLLGQEIGAEFDFDITKIEDKDQKYIDKYLLKKPEDSNQEIGNFFRGTVQKALRVQLAELDEELFTNLQLPEVNDETSLRGYLEKDLLKYYQQQAKNLMERNIFDELKSQANYPLPDVFLKRYLKDTNENVSEEDIENEFPAFAENLNWSLQKAKLVKDFEIEVAEQEIKQFFLNKVFSFLQQYPNMDYSFIEPTIEKMMKDKAEVDKAYEEIMVTKLFAKIGETVNHNIIPISEADFVEKVKALNSK